MLSYEVPTPYTSRCWSVIAPQLHKAVVDLAVDIECHMELELNFKLGMIDSILFYIF